MPSSFGSTLHKLRSLDTGVCSVTKKHCLESSGIHLHWGLGRANVG